MSPLSKGPASTRKDSPTQGGFTLIELLVTIGIVSVIMSVIFLNQSSYVDTTALTNLADTISLTLRQAQVYGIAVKELSAGSADFSAGYGLTFSLLPSGSNTKYLYFADRNSNSVYDGGWDCATGGVAECLEATEMLRGDYLDSICVITSSSSDDCASAKRADITFRRPDPPAYITLFDSAAQSFTPANFRGVKLVLKSPAGLSRSILVYTSGQISVQ